MAGTSYLNLDLRIERAQDRYCARIVDSPSGQASCVFDLPFSPLELENIVLKVGRGRRGVRRIESSEMQTAKDFGGRLFNAVFAGDVRACLRSSLAEAQNQEAGLRIRLHLPDTPELINVPWEFTYDPAVNRFLTLSTETPLVRYMDLPERVRPVSVTPPLRILAMIASPSDYPPLDVELEWSRMQAALADLQERGLVALDLVREASLAALQHALRQEDYHIFHFVGHGAFDVATQDGVLLMLDASGRGVTVSGQYLGTLLHDQRTLRLAVLNACEGARSGAADPFAGAAQSLVQQGLPAVIAMQFEISDQAAITLSHEFYAALADGYPVDAALGEARKALYGQVSDMEWATPVLYLRAPDGRIFDVASVAESELRRSRQVSELVRRAQEAAAAGNWAQAESEWQAVLNLDPAHSAAKAGYEAAGRRRQTDTLNKGVKVAREQGDWPTVVSKLEALLKLDPGNSAAVAELNEARRQDRRAAVTAEAQSAEQRQEWDAAATLWQSVVDLAPDDRQAVERLRAARQQVKQSVRSVRPTPAAATPAAQATVAQAPVALIPVAPKPAAQVPVAPARRVRVWAIRGVGALAVILLAVFLVQTAVQKSHTPQGPAGPPLGQAIAVFNGQSYVAFAANDPGNRLMYLSSPDGANWSEARFIGEEASKSVPAMATFNDRLYAAFVANHAGNELLIVSSGDGAYWAPNRLIGGQRSPLAPAMAMLNGRLYVAFVSDDPTNRLLYVSSADGTNWTTEHAIGQETSKAAPAMAVFNGRLYAAFVANHAGSRLLIVSSGDGANWASNRLIGDQRSQFAPTMAVLNGRLYVAFVSDDAARRLLYVSSADTVDWTPERPIAEESAKAAPVMTTFNNTLRITFVANNTSNRVLTVSSGDGVNWSQSAVLH